jgi:Kef-type K+ transport system membrane component KefB
LVDNACLSVIGLSAGAELSARDLRGQNAKKIIVWTMSIAVFTWLTVFTAFTVGGVSERVQFLEDGGSSSSGTTLGAGDASVSWRYGYTLRACAVGSLIATLSIARSPASAIAVLRETEARGPFAKMVVSVTVLKDVLVVVLFALNMEMIESLGFMNTSSGSSSSSSSSSVSSSDSSNSVSSTDMMMMTMNETSGGGRHLAAIVGGEETNDYEYQMRSIIHALEPVVSVFGSFVFGFFAGAPLHSVLRRLPSPPAQQTDNHFSASLKTRFRALMRQSMKPLFTIVYSTTIFVVSKRLFLLEPLLVCVCCGIFCANRGNFSSVTANNAASSSLQERDASASLRMTSSPPSPSSGGGSANTNATTTTTTTTNKLAQQQLFNAIGSKSLHSSLVSLQPAVNLVFFTLAGVALEMEHVMRSAQAAVLLVAFRILGIFIACRIASRLLSSSSSSSSISPENGGSENIEEQQRKVAWMAHVTQAGVALGLARTCSVKFSAWGEQFASVATAMIALNLLIGPPLFRSALTRVGEARVVVESIATQTMSLSSSASGAAGPNAGDVA